MARSLMEGLSKSEWPPERVAAIEQEMGKMEMFLKPADRLFPLQVGTELFIDAPDAQPNSKIQFRFDVAFGEPDVVEGEPLLETLQAAIAYVEKVVTGFKGLLA